MPSLCAETVTTSAVMPSSFSELRSASSVVVPARTPIRLAGERMQAHEVLARRDDAGAVNEGGDREIYGLATSQGGAGRFAEEVDPPFRHRIKPVRSGH